MATNAVGDGVDAPAKLLELGGETGQGEGVSAPEPMLLDEGAQIGPSIQRRPADPGLLSDGTEGHRSPGRGEFIARPFDPGHELGAHDASARAMSASRRSMSRRWRSASSPQPRRAASAARALASARCAARIGRNVASVRKFGQCSQMFV